MDLKFPKLSLHNKNSPIKTNLHLHKYLTYLLKFGPNIVTDISSNILFYIFKIPNWEHSLKEKLKKL